MATVRRFGPVLGAGTTVSEKQGDRSIVASGFGTTAYVVPLEKGEIGTLITCTGKKDLLKKTGGFIPDFVGPDCCQDFFEHGNGAGSLLLLRATDGNEQTAYLDLYDRKNPRNKVVKAEAKNGGGWGGRRQTWVLDISSVPGDLGTTYIDLPIAFSCYEDQFKGGTISLPGSLGGNGASYKIVSNAASDGVGKTRVTVEADQDVVGDFGVASDPECFIVVGQTDSWGRNRNLAVEIQDGKDKPSTEWGIYVYEHGELVYTQPNLSSDPNASNYFVQVINNDGNNHYIKVTDLWSGAISAAVRPANYWAEVAKAKITATGIDLGDTICTTTQSSGADNTIASFTFGSSVMRDRYRLTLTMPGPTWALQSLDQQTLKTFTAPTDAVAYVADNIYSIGFTVTEVTGVNGETIDVVVEPLVESELVGGKIFFPNHSAHPARGFRISANTETAVSIASGDLTDGGAIPSTTEIRLQYPQQLGFGYDGLSDFSDTDFTQHYDPASSKFNDVVGKGFGLIKFATPGITAISGVNAVTVEKAGINYAATKNHQYRSEIPFATTDEYAARTYVQDTLGRSAHHKVIHPSWCYVSDPIQSGRLKQVPTTGMVHGREARTATIYEGYHKAAAGVDHTLPKIVKLPTDYNDGQHKVLDQEVTNPAGLQIVDKRGGNFVIWGDRMPTDDPAFIFVHHREQLSYYEHVLSESFDWLIFAINDEQEQPAALAALRTLFLPEYRKKRALRGDSFEDACSLKIDGDNNTDATRASGDLNAEIKLRLADTIERFNITIGKEGIFENVV